jgi:hypothetical protein
LKQVVRDVVAGPVYGVNGWLGVFVIPPGYGVIRWFGEVVAGPVYGSQYLVVRGC